MKIYFKGKAWRLVSKRQRLPNGRMTLVEVIEHPGAVVIVPFIKKETIILLRQFRPTIQRYLYELPAGTIDPGESPLACAKREVIEETGFRARKMTKVNFIYPVPGYSTEVITIFKAQDLIKDSALKDPDEIIRTEMVTQNQIRRLFRSGKIVDAKTICALAFIGWI